MFKSSVSEYGFPVLQAGFYPRQQHQDIKKKGGKEAYHIGQGQL